jgi:glycosyltransferase involved in cell wall biosynthesis
MDKRSGRRDRCREKFRVRSKLSVITPSLNQGRFIERTIRSVLDQGYESLEYIVVDGGSTDGSVEIIDRYRDRLAWSVSEPDRGQAHALNKGLRRATGEYLAYINSDDYYLPGAFDAAVSTFEKTGASWVVGTCCYVDTEGRLTIMWVPELPMRGRHWWMLAPWGVPQAATFWRRDLLERFGPFREDMHYVFDTEYGLRLAYNGVLPAIVEGELATRLIHPEAKSWNTRLFERERRRFVELYAEVLTPRERVALRTTRTLQALGWYRARALAGRAKRKLLGTGSPSSGIIRVGEQPGRGPGGQ